MPRPHRPAINRFEAAVKAGANPARIRSRYSLGVGVDDLWYVLSGAAIGGFGGWLIGGAVSPVAGQAAAGFGMLALTVSMVAWRMVANTVEESADFYERAAGPEAEPEPVAAFVPDVHNPRTLSRIPFPLRKLQQFAQGLPDVDYRLAYAEWEGGGKLFTRAEYKALRDLMQRSGYEADNALTEHGFDAVAAWRGGEFGDVVEFYRPTPSA